MSGLVEFALQLLVKSPVNNAHSAGADFFFYAIPPKLAANVRHLPSHDCEIVARQSQRKAEMEWERSGRLP